MVNYQNGKIYKLVNDVDDEIYIGSTCARLADRKSGHKGDAKRHPNYKVYKHLNKIGWENVHIVLIKKCPCENKDELFRQERYYIEKLKPSLNKLRPIVTKEEAKKEMKEYNRKYKQEHQKEINKKQRERYKKNNEKEREYRRKYYEEHKEQCKDYVKQYAKRQKEKKQEENIED